MHDHTTLISRLQHVSCPCDAAVRVIVVMGTDVHRILLAYSSLRYIAQNYANIPECQCNLARAFLGLSVTEEAGVAVEKVQLLLQHCINLLVRAAL